MIDHTASILENDAMFTQGFMIDPHPMRYDQEPLDEAWVLEQALEVGLTIEEGSFRMYTDAKKTSRNPGSVQLLKELAEDTLVQKEKMVNAYQNFHGVSGVGTIPKIVNLSITDSMKCEQLSSRDTFQDILIFAARREKISYDFFSMQANDVKNDSIKRIWENLAELKLSQKNKIESEYDDVVLHEN